MKVLNPFVQEDDNDDDEGFFVCHEHIRFSRALQFFFFFLLTILPRLQSVCLEFARLFIIIITTTITTTNTITELRPPLNRRHLHFHHVPVVSIQQCVPSLINIFFMVLTFSLTVSFEIYTTKFLVTVESRHPLKTHHSRDNFIFNRYIFIVNSYYLFKFKTTKMFPID